MVSFPINCVHLVSRVFTWLYLVSIDFTCSTQTIVDPLGLERKGEHGLKRREKGRLATYHCHPIQPHDEGTRGAKHVTGIGALPLASPHPQKY